MKKVNGVKKANEIIKNKEDRGFNYFVYLINDFAYQPTLLYYCIRWWK